MKRRIALQLIVSLLMALTVGQYAHSQEAPSKELDDYINKALKDWDVPGLALAVVKNDQIVFAKGYGVRKIGDPTPVDEKTVFAIGSSSKAFTAASIAMLVDEGKVKLDDPATKYFPGFQLFDPYVTREITVRDLLCHRSGLERGDFLWYGTKYDRDEIVRRVRYLKPSWSFRSNFGYQNIMYLTAGQIVARVSGKSWDDFIRDRFFKPLGMTASSTSINALKEASNVATPHAKIDNKVEVIPWRNIDNIAPAGSINSNVVDMAQWLRLNLGEGSYKGQRLISSGGTKELHTAQTIIRMDPPWTLFYSDAHFLNYGLGWFLHDHRGRKVVEHGGNIDGMSALVSMIPEEKLGLVILTNMNGTPMTAAIANRVYDVFLGAQPKDYSAELLKTYNGLLEQQKQAEKKADEARVKGTSPTLALDQYAGTYSDEMYGDARVSLQNGKLVLATPGFTGELAHWNYDTFQVTWRERSLGKALVTFTLNARGKVDELKLPELQASFKRAADKAEATAAVNVSEADLKRLAGKYEAKVPPIEVSIELIGGSLKATVPGQPLYTLRPVSPTKFKIEGAPDGFFVNFELSDGKAKSMTIEQGPGPSLTLTPKQ
ncbi:MAG TPA: serine hydrolase [Blastocatellia bacterium]|nr:serine hydrolase [Blastocatellia bacterium]